MDRLSLIVALSVHSLTNHRVKTAVSCLIVATGTLVMVLGLALVSSVEKATRDSITSSITGHIQVWSASGQDEISLINLGSEEPDIGELPDFASVERALLGVQGVRSAVPMATGSAFSPQPTDIDHAIENLRKAQQAGETSELPALKAQVQQLAAALGETFANQRENSSDPASWEARIDVAHEVASDAFWVKFDEQPDETLLYLDTQFAPLSPTGQPLYIDYLATDPAQFSQAFDRFRLVQGEMIPPGRRGLLLAKRSMERFLKHPVAAELDAIKAERDRGRTFAQDDLLRDRAAALARQSSKITLQLAPTAARELRVLLAAQLGQEHANLNALVRSFLDLSDANFDERFAFFYKEVAPRVRLYQLEPGESVVLTAFTKSGAIRSVIVPVWGVFEFEGLETSSLASSRDILDLVSFRRLYGEVSEDERAEIEELRTVIGVEAIDQESAEDELFGASAEPGPPVVAPTPLPDRLETARALPDTYDPGEARRGLVTSVAVILDDVTATDDVLPRIAQLDGLRAVGWQAAAGIVGQFTRVMTAVLWIAVVLIFVVAGVVLNNAMLLSTHERTTEIGTLRAIGGRRRFILALILTETLLTTILGAAVGATAAAAVLAWLGAVGIPATSGVMVMLFGGDRLYPSMTLGSVFVSLVVVLVVSLLAAFFPARVAVGVPPIVAMRGD